MLTFDNGNGYVFAYTMDGDPHAGAGFRPDEPEPHWTSTPSGGELVRELRDGVAANSEIMFRYEFRKPGQDELIRKFSYAVPIPGWTCSSAPAPISTISTPRSKNPMAPVVLGFRLGITLVRRHRLDDEPRYLETAEPARRPHAGPRRRPANDEDLQHGPRRRDRRDGCHRPDLQGQIAVRIRGLEQKEAAGAGAG